jgi:hypothetical protein
MWTDMIGRSQATMGISWRETRTAGEASVRVGDDRESAVELIPNEVRLVLTDVEAVLALRLLCCSVRLRRGGPRPCCHWEEVLAN